MAVTVIVRNEVAVGIDRLSSMYLASIAAPPLSGWRGPRPSAACAPPPAGAGGGGRRSPATIEDILLGDPAAGSRAGDGLEVDPLGRGDARGDGRDLRAV